MISYSIIDRIDQLLHSRAKKGLKTKRIYLGFEEYREYCREYSGLYDYGEFRVYCGDRTEYFYHGIEIRMSKKQNYFRAVK